MVDSGSKGSSSYSHASTYAEAPQVSTVIKSPVLRRSTERMDKISTILAIVNELVTIYNQLHGAGFFDSGNWKNKLLDIAVHPDKYPHTLKIVDALHSSLDDLPAIEEELRS